MFLDDLPRWEKGTYRGKINWEKCIGYKVKFIYNDIEDEVEIVDYIKKEYKLKIKNSDREDIVYINNFSKCQLGGILRVKTKEYRYSVGDAVLDVKSGDLEILKRIKIKRNNQKSEKGYKYKCLICGNEDEISENNLKRKQGCNVCCLSSRKTRKGINDIHTTHPQFGKWFWEHKDGYEYTCNSDKKTDFKCLDCGEKIKDKRIASMFNGYFDQNKTPPCPSCSDGISYPNKLMYNVLKQVKEHSKNISFITEFSPKWAIIRGHKNKKINGKKRYDFYVKAIVELENKKKIVSFIIEIQGMQHFKEKSKSSNWVKSLQEEQENDRQKKFLANENLRCKYIVIDARYSELGYIKQSVVESNLSKLINLDFINWEKVENDTQKSVVKDAWNYWNGGVRNTFKIAQLIGVSKTTAIGYLKRGAELKKCDYDAKEVMKKTGLKIGKMSGKPVIQLSLKGEYINEHKSATEAGRKIDVRQGDISQVCSGKRKTAGGFKWMFKEDWFRKGGIT